MEQRNPTGFWFKSDFTQSPLREPRLKSSDQSSRPAQQAGPTEEPPVVKQTILRADAPEFVPTRTFEQQQIRGLFVDNPQGAPRHSVQNRLNKAKNVNQNTQYSSPGSSSYATPQAEQPANPSNESHTNITDLVRLRQIISSLINYPGQFDDLLIVFMETIYPYFLDSDALAQIAHLLVGEAVNSPNFRYNGVRLCWYAEKQCPEFGAKLYDICEKELETDHNQQNVMLFIAELYIQLSHFSHFGYLLIYALNKLLGVGGNDNIKCVCQALKLTGYALEQNQSQSLNELFLQLKTSSSSLSGSALTILNSVINLRQSNWGRSAPESNSSEASDYDHDYEEIVTGILYEAEGQTLTNEEQEFLAAHATQDEYLSDSDDPDALCDPEPEMDDEIQAAFEEFVKLNKH
ncbi:polyadenylate-binding protein-interacting protein 1 [Dendroctonus ponderosae]|uniref:MIF4G domain-containing protein n=1 Tax=Dendroctonus ponderosae TaxID=77166 RepID=U4UEI9_DENPD|nr:polyadenylate-binding protein-interacting protein 1 [Dendroctonus ponderosae]ERL92374.1 hypothetical protein D910_09688 [Dendroctonus ponderosae]